MSCTISMKQFDIDSGTSGPAFGVELASWDEIAQEIAAGLSPAAINSLSHGVWIPSKDVDRLARESVRWLLARLFKTNGHQLAEIMRQQMSNLHRQEDSK